ncbi:hypothetical protein EDB80DRAFT_691339 [Ilyonectria destructans]|nr:hypothetical protein EDB80DRAFT_691339 [Ilyonectria destructans]
MNRRMKSSSRPTITGVLAGDHFSKSRYSDVGMQQVSEEGSVDFSRIQSPLFIESHHNKCKSYGLSQELVVELARENGKLRYRISRDKNLVTKALIHLVTELAFHASGLTSPIQRTESHPEKAQITEERVSIS